MESLQSEGLWLDDEDFDMTVTIDDDKFNCVRCILSNRCSFFRNLFGSTKHKKYYSSKEPEKLPKHIYVNLDGFPGGEATFQSILNFCYAKKIQVRADKCFLYLDHAAALLGMTKCLKSGMDNLKELCDLYWKDHILSSWEAIFDVMDILKNGNLALPKEKVDEYWKHCLEGLGPELNGKNLTVFFRRLLLLSKENWQLVMKSTPAYKKSKFVIGFSCSVQILGNGGISIVDHLGLIAKSIILLKTERMEELDAKNLSFLQDFMVPLDAKPITYLLVILQAFSNLMHKEEVDFDHAGFDDIKLTYFKTLRAEDLGIFFPESGLQLICNLYASAESKDLKESLKMLILSYLRYCKKACSPLPFKTFFAFGKAFSGMLKDCHDALYDEIISYNHEVSMTEEEKRSLGNLVNCAILSSDRVEKVLENKFPFSVKDYVSLLRNEIASLKDQYKSKLCNLTTHKRKCSRIIQRSGTEKKIMTVKLASSSDLEKVSWPLKNNGYANLANSSSSFYISVLTLHEEWICFSIRASDAMAAIKRKLTREMERNSIKVPCCSWCLTYRGIQTVNNSTAQDNGIERHSLLRMQILSCSL